MKCRSIVEVIPRPANEDGWGYWCYHCKKDLGHARRMRPYYQEFMEMIRCHVKQHRLFMRSQI